MTNAEQKRIFARNLDRLIVKSGHTRQEVADALGFNPDAENGKHRINAISSVPRGKFRGIKKDPHRKCDEGFSLLSSPALRPHGCPDPAFRKRLADVFLADVLVGPEDVTIVYNAKEAPYGPGEGSHSASSRGGQVTAYKPVVIGPLIFFRLPRQ